MSDFRDTRVGVTNAARLLGVSVTELKEAVRTKSPLRGVEPPPPIGFLGTSATQMHFRAGDVMDCADLIRRQGGKA